MPKTSQPCSTLEMNNSITYGIPDLAPEDYELKFNLFPS